MRARSTFFNYLQKVYNMPFSCAEPTNVIVAIVLILVVFLATDIIFPAISSQDYCAETSSY